MTDPRPVLVMEHTRQRYGIVEAWTWGDLVERLSWLRLCDDKIAVPSWAPVRMVEDGRILQAVDWTGIHTLDRPGFLPVSQRERNVARCPAGPAAEPPQSSDVLTWAPRKRSHVAGVWAMVCDVDDTGTDLQSIDRTVAGLGLTALLHTTWSNTGSAPKLRIVFPLDCEAPADRWLEVWSAGQRWAESWGASIDQACKDPSRIYYMPAVREGDWDAVEAWRWVEYRGDLLSWRKLIADYPAPQVERDYRPPSPARWGLREDRLNFEGEQRQIRALAFLTNRCRWIAEAPEGQRNNRVYSGAVSVHRWCLAGYLPEAKAQAELVAAAVAAGLSASEAQSAIDSGIKEAERQGPWTEF